MTELSKTMDKIGFELFEKSQPKVIEAINEALDKGDTATKIERALYKRFGRYSITATLVACAAHYLESQRKAK